MKRLLVVLTLLICAFALRVVYVQYKERNQRTEFQIGEYYLDINRTKLGVYEKNKALLKNLKIQFKDDGTFYLNMDVPFLPDSLGKWKSGGNNEFNIMSFQNFESFKAQYSECCNSDSIFTIDVILPKKGKQALDIIYFKKVNPSVESLKNYEMPQAVR
jgi:hypothetical protein